MEFIDRMRLFVNFHLENANLICYYIIDIYNNNLRRQLMEFVSSKVIKGVDRAGGKILSSYLVNRITQKRLDFVGIEFGVSYFIKEMLFRTSLLRSGLPNDCVVGLMLREGSR